MIWRAALVLAVLRLLVSAEPAEAHAALASASPADGAILESGPAEIRLVFNEPVRLLSFSLVDARAQQALSHAPPRIDGATISVDAPSLADGGYIVSWRVVSADGHPVSGAFVFQVGAGAAGAPPAPGIPEDAAAPLGAIGLRFAAYALTALAVGGAAFLAFVLGERRREVALRNHVLGFAAGAAASLLIGAAVEFRLAGADAAVAVEIRGSAVLPPAALNALMSVAGLALIAAGLRWLPPPRAIVGAGALATAAGFAFAGHAATAPPTWLARPAVALHLLAASLWIGAFWPLVWVVWRSPTSQAAAPAVRRFSRLASGVVALLLATAAVLAVLQLGAFSALWRSDYGLLLLAKIAAVAAMLGLAALNRQRLTPALAGGTGRGALVRSIAAEMGLAVAVLALTAALGATPPPRAITARAAVTQKLEARSGPYAVRIEVSPAGSGSDMQVRFTRLADGAPLRPWEATAAFSQPTLGIGPIIRPLKPSGDAGAFTLPGSELPANGRWRLRIEALVTDFEKVAFDAEIDLDR